MWGRSCLEHLSSQHRHWDHWCRGRVDPRWDRTGSNLAAIIQGPCVEKPIAISFQAYFSIEISYNVKNLCYADRRGSWWRFAPITFIPELSLFQLPLSLCCVGLLEGSLQRLGPGLWDLPHRSFKRAARLQRRPGRGCPGQPLEKPWITVSLCLDPFLFPHQTTICTIQFLSRRVSPTRYNKFILLFDIQTGSLLSSRKQMTVHLGVLSRHYKITSKCSLSRASFFRDKFSCGAPGWDVTSKSSLNPGPLQ